MCFTLLSSALKEHHGWPLVYESVRFLLFSNSGLLNPISHFDFLIKYKKPTVGQKILTGMQLRKLIRGLYSLNPLPYHQSPIPHPYFLDVNILTESGQGPTKASSPKLVSIGNEELIKITEYFPKINGFQSWIPVNRIRSDQPPKYSFNTLEELTRKVAPHSCYSRNLRGLFSLPTFRPTHLDQSTQTSFTSQILLDLTHKPGQTIEKKSQTTQTEGMVLLTFNGQLNIINTPKVQTEYIRDSCEQVKLITFPIFS